ncbi:hypothetical protein BJX68DRAFT_270121 [Aspergillus pseudodeflectus]|uniref:Uncharacterized protein n=1 Tax=Aspergillus pseudodeflectus TaxID=176178 RepID=A0ABR4JWT9_9EURO
MISHLPTLCHAASTLAVTFNVPASPPANASKRLSAAPVGVSLEFFTFLEYITDVPATTACLENLKDLTGVWPPLRIATQGGCGISPAFGAALWIVDYVMPTVLMGTEVSAVAPPSQYCWWGRYTTGARYYGAYRPNLALANADQIAPLDDQTSSMAAYAIYHDGEPVRVLLGQSPTIAGQTFGNGDYAIEGTAVVEAVEVVDGEATFTVAASEALLVYL